MVMTDKKITEASYAHLVPVIEPLLRQLVSMGLQNIPTDRVKELAANQAKLLVCIARILGDQEWATIPEGMTALSYAAVVDYALYLVQSFKDGQKLQLLELVGRPLTNDEMIRYFFYGA